LKFFRQIQQKGKRIDKFSFRKFSEMNLEAVVVCSRIEDDKFFLQACIRSSPVQTHHFLKKCIEAVVIGSTVSHKNSNLTKKLICLVSLKVLDLSTLRSKR
jgi:hypothetical protein